MPPVPVASTNNVASITSELGYVPVTRVVLDHPGILVSARPKIQVDSNQTHTAHKNKPTSSQPIHPPPNQIDLPTVGSGYNLAWGLAASCQIAAAA